MPTQVKSQHLFRTIGNLIAKHFRQPLVDIFLKEHSMDRTFHGQDIPMDWTIHGQYNY